MSKIRIATGCLAILTGVIFASAALAAPPVGVKGGNFNGKGVNNGRNFNGGFNHGFNNNFNNNFNRFDRGQFNVAGWGWGFGSGGDFDSLNWENRLPYYALHPPVYYSYPVARPFGYSPFPYPGDFITPEVASGYGPANIINPFVPSAPAESITPQDKQPSEMPTPADKSKSKIKAGTIGNQTAAMSSNDDKVLIIINPYVKPAPAAEVISANE